MAVLTINLVLILLKTPVPGAFFVEFMRGYAQ